MDNYFLQIFDSMENPDLKTLAEKCFETIPPYFWTVGASSTGKYHPLYALGDHGLARHTLALCRFMNHLFGIESISKQFNSRERDAMRIAGMMHDSRKSGSQEDYESNKYTRFNHPILAAEAVRDVCKKNPDLISDDLATIICDAISSHMGQFNIDKRSNVTLPKPKNKYDILLHCCDYLASRKDISVSFNNLQVSDHDEVTWENYTLPFGKYKGMTWKQIDEQDNGYVQWALAKMDSQNVKQYLLDYLEDKKKNGKKL